MADSPADVSEANRRPAARIHADGAIPRRLPSHTVRAVRARRLLSIHRPRPGTRAGCFGWTQRALRILTGAPLGVACAPGIRPGAGVHAGQWRLSALIPSQAGAPAAGGAA